MFAGLAYFEAIALGPMQGHLGFHSPWFKAEFGKLGSFDVTSLPNMGKTTLARTALSLASHPSFLFAFKVNEGYYYLLDT
jgi:hypothetical protein